MLVWVIYDISKNKTRNLIVKFAQEKGLYRVQKSVFVGSIEASDLDEIAIYSEELINIETDSVYIFPMCNNDFNSAILQGQAFDKRMVSDEIKSLFF